MDALTLIDAEIARLQECRATLVRLMGVGAATAAAAVVVELPPGKPSPRRVASPGPSGEPRRVLIARRLMNGPCCVSELVAAGLGSQPTINAVLRGSPAWFRKAGPGMLDPWELTEVGRDSTATSGPASP